MPTANRLTDHACRGARPRDRPYKLFDGHGLALWVSPTGARVWRWHYRIDGRAQTRSLGPYPEVTLARARAEVMRLRAELRAGALAPRSAARNPLTVRKACEDYWHGRQDCTERYRAHALRALELHIWPAIGSAAVADLDRAAVMAPLLRLDAAGRAEYVRKVRLWLSMALARAVELGEARGNPAADIKPERAFARRAVEHHAALDLREVPALLQRLDLEGVLQSAEACRLLALTWARTGELRQMRWDELDGDLWRLPGGRMKRRKDHLVPLSAQALAVLERMRRRRGASVYVFPSDRRDDRPMSENAVLYLLHRMGYKGRMTGHGWRTLASTWAHEAGYPPDVIERQLAHTPDDRVRAAYNRAAYLPERRAMLSAWADWLDRQAGAVQA
jgi:integrase